MLGFILNTQMDDLGYVVDAVYDKKDLKYEIIHNGGMNGKEMKYA